MALLEMLEFRFGAFEAIAYAALELAGKDPEVALPMDERTARAILELGDDLRQATRAAKKSTGAEGECWLCVYDHRSCNMLHADMRSRYTPRGGDVLGRLTHRRVGSSCRVGPISVPASIILIAVVPAGALKSLRICDANQVTFALK